MMSLRWWEELLPASSCWGWETGDERAAVRTLSSLQCRRTRAQSAMHVHCSAFWWAGAHAGVRSMCKLFAWLCDILPGSSAYRVCPVASREEAVRGWKVWFMRSNDFLVRHQAHLSENRTLKRADWAQAIRGCQSVLGRAALTWGSHWWLSTWYNLRRATKSPCPPTLPSYRTCQPPLSFHLEGHSLLSSLWQQRRTSFLEGHPVNVLFPGERR